MAQRFSSDRLCCWHTILATVLITTVATPAWPWGDQTHPFINRLAVETLSLEAAVYYRPSIDMLARRSVEPDSIMRAREGRAEAIRHFFDLDAHMAPPFTDFPRTYRRAVEHFGKSQVERHGVLPWVILRFHRQLREAIGQGDRLLAMQQAAYLGHYVADAFQPQHLTRDHDGQFSGAAGFHKRFENGLVDAKLEPYSGVARQLIRPARVLTDPRDAIFTVMFESYTEVQLLRDADLSAYKKHRRGSSGYYDRLDSMLAPVVARQLSKAATMLGSLWLTAWTQGSDEQ